MAKRRVSREIRTCVAPDCDITFRVLVGDPKKYCSRSCASRTTAKRVLREVRICAHPSCDTIFEVRVTSGQKSCCGKCQCNRSQPPNWNVGLTKETDERVRRNAESIAAVWTPEKRKEWGRRFSGENNGMFGKKRPDLGVWNRKYKAELVKGKNNPNWHGGIGNLPYPFEFNKEFKELVRERYGHTCVVCKRKQDQLKRKLDVHHIDYAKDNLDPDNFVPLCRSCHVVTSVNRIYWTKTFQRIVGMNRRCGMNIVISPHPDDCLIGCYSLIKKKLIGTVLYIDPSPSRFALAQAAGEALGFTAGLLEFRNLYTYLEKNPAHTYLVPDASDTHFLHIAVNSVARQTGRRLGYYSTDMAASFIRELSVEEQKEKREALNKYYFDQSSLWENDWKYFLFEGVVLDCTVEVSTLKVSATLHSPTVNVEDNKS